MQILSTRLRALIRRFRTSQYALAQTAGISRQTLQNVLHGKAWPDLVTIHRLEVAVDQRLWVNADLGRDVERLPSREFHRHDRGFTLIGFVTTDKWRAEVSPTSRARDSWHWGAFVLTDEGWTRDGEGTAADHAAATETADAHVADRTAAEPSQPEEQVEQPARTDAADET